MQTIAITLEQPVSKFVERQSKSGKKSPQETVLELVTKGFETLLQEKNQRYRQGEISFGKFAQELGITTWELSHLLEEHGWLPYNLPSQSI